LDRRRHRLPLRPRRARSGLDGGRIERVDLASGAIEAFYTHCDSEPLKGPNGLVFDRQGGFWFTDLGKTYGRVMDRGAVYYARRSRRPSVRRMQRSGHRSCGDRR
jgi:gluconolactonase